MKREEFLDRINQEGFSFSINMTRWAFRDFKVLVRSRRLSLEQIYQMFVEFCEELENCLAEAGDERRIMFNKYPVNPVLDKYKTQFDLISPNGREFRFDFVFRNDNHLKVYHLYEMVNGRKKVTWKDILWEIVEVLYLESSTR